MCINEFLLFAMEIFFYLRGGGGCQNRISDSLKFTLGDCNEINNFFYFATLKFFDIFSGFPNFPD